jgi:4,5-DOPA dioxygenase extradiol
MSQHVIPAAFFGHGSPMNVLEHNQYTQGWYDFGRAIPQPRAILVISAHWYVNATVVTAMNNPRTIHDFYGFPQELFDVQYPAPGSVELAEDVIALASPTWVGKDLDSWGFDHGTWSVLHHMFPNADVPVVQLSIDANKSFEEHIALGAALAPLAESGVLILGIGNVVHNLGKLDWNTPDSGQPWALRFDTSVRHLMTTDPQQLSTITSHEDYELAVPTPEHFIPLLYIAGIATAKHKTAKPLLSGYAMGSLSMTSYIIN